MRLSVPVLLIATVLSAFHAHACRLWGVVAHEGHTLSESDSDNFTLVSEELRAFYRQGVSQPQGWSLGFFRNDRLIEDTTLFRSSVPTTQDSARYFQAMDVMLAPSTTARCAIGHLRTASSGSASIPDPHPFLFTRDSVCFSLVHNGTIDKEILLALLTRGGKDSSWLKKNPPHTYGNNDWRSGGLADVVDSELLLLWLMKNVDEAGDLLTGLAIAADQLAVAVPSACQTNFILSDGKRLYASGGKDCLYYRFGVSKVTYGDKTYLVNHQAVMTEPPATGLATNLGWTSVQDHHLVVLSADTTVINSSEALVALAKKNAVSIKNACYYDNDGDGSIDSIPVITSGSLSLPHYNEIIDSNLITLPAQRHFSVTKYRRISDTAIAFLVVQDSARSEDPLTGIQPYDVLTTSFTHYFSTGGRMYAGNTAIDDRVPPVILSARVSSLLSDSGGISQDTLRVVFSESVKPYPDSQFQPFVVLRHDGSTIERFTPALSPCNDALSSEQHWFVIDRNDTSAAAFRFKRDDSIFINTRYDHIGDVAVPPNFQRSETNPRRLVVIDTVIVAVHPRRAAQWHSQQRIVVMATEAGYASLEIFSLTGRSIHFSTLPVLRNQRIGVTWSGGGSGLAKGMALYILTAGRQQMRGMLPVCNGQGFRLWVMGN
jgi:hypothetical protein